LCVTYVDFGILGPAEALTPGKWYIEMVLWIRYVLKGRSFSAFEYATQELW
jgi:hypothetical protein